MLGFSAAYPRMKVSLRLRHNKIILTGGQARGMLAVHERRFGLPPLRPSSAADDAV